MTFQDLVTEGAAGALRTKTISPPPRFLWNMRRNTAQVCGHTVWCTYYTNVCLKLALLNCDGELMFECYSDVKWPSEESESGGRNCSESNTNKLSSKIIKDFKHNLQQVVTFSEFYLCSSLYLKTLHVWSKNPCK